MSWSLIEAEIENKSNSNWVIFFASGAFRRERSNLDPVETGTGLDQLGFLLINDGKTKAGSFLFGVCTTREMFLHGVHSANLLSSQFEQVLQK